MIPTALIQERCGIFPGIFPLGVSQHTEHIPCPRGCEDGRILDPALLLPEQEEGHQPGFSLSPHKELQVGGDVAVGTNLV